MSDLNAGLFVLTRVLPCRQVPAVLALHRPVRSTRYVLAGSNRLRTLEKFRIYVNTYRCVLFTVAAVDSKLQALHIE